MVAVVTQLSHLSYASRTSKYSYYLLMILIEKFGLIIENKNQNLLLLLIISKHREMRVMLNQSFEI